MSLENKIIGIVFIQDLEIKECFLNELIKLNSIYNVTLIPILKEKYFNKNINQFSKITKNKPIFYNRDIIVKKSIKKFDFLILVGCSNNIISKLVNKKFNNNILNIIKICKINKTPIIIGVNIKNFSNISLKNLELLYGKNGYYFIPFKVTNPITAPNKLCFESTFLIKTLFSVKENIQIEPLISFL